MFHALGVSTYVLDLIEVLLPGGSAGVQRAAALRAIELSRRRLSRPIPEKFDEVVQSEFNRYCGTSAVFKKRGAPTDALFASRRDGNTAVWSVDPERAAIWLAAQVHRLKVTGDS